MDALSSLSLSSWIYGTPLLVLLGAYFWKRRRIESKNLAAWADTKAAGLDQPVSLHPEINRNRCMGCGACADACPQGDVLGIVEGQAELVGASQCIGHGACRASCPTDAISLVIGTETRGVEIPLLDPNFQTAVPGVFVAGELGGMGLIRNAIEQGRQAVEAISKLPGIGEGDRVDLVIVGAGPAGFGATLAAMQMGLRSVTLEQDTLGGSIRHHPRGKVIVTHPVDIPLVGQVRIRETTKESLLDFWERVRSEQGVRIRESERVERVEREGDGFRVQTSKSAYETRAVLLAVGRRGTPRKLGVPGETQEKVVYRLVSPEQYRGKRVLVVGAGDSALEAAARLAELPDVEVTLAARGDAFVRANARSQQNVERAAADGSLSVRMRTTVSRIEADAVDLVCDGRSERLPNDAVIVCAGGVLPKDFLQQIGIAVETRFGTPLVHEAGGHS